MQLINELIEVVTNKKAEDVLILDVTNRMTIIDYFFICSGSSSRHVHALMKAIEEFLYTQKIRPHHIEGNESSSWILIDLGDLLIHIFHEKSRKFYQLENLWRDARVLFSSNPLIT